MIRNVLVTLVAFTTLLVLAAPAQAAQVHRGTKPLTLTLYVSNDSDAGLFAPEINAQVRPAIQRVKSIGGSYSCMPTYSVFPAPTKQNRTDIQRGVRVWFEGQQAFIRANHAAPRGERSWTIDTWCADIWVQVTLTVNVH